MIPVKIIKKPKRTASVAGGGTTSYYQTSTDTVSYAESAGNATYATKAGTADYAENASRASYATTAATADTISANSEIYTLFLRKDIDDTAAGVITFDAGTVTNENADFGTFFSDWLLGTGARIDDEGNAEFKSLKVRESLDVAQLVFNKINARDSEDIISPGRGTIESVTKTGEKTGTITLKLQDNEWATVAAGDICRGIYNNLEATDATAWAADGDDANGFRKKKGFFTVYFRVMSVTTNQAGSCTFSYILQSTTTEHPCPNMNFAVYGSFTNTSRQSSIYITSVGIAPRMLFLGGVNNYAISANNIKAALGNIEGLSVYEIVDGVQTAKTLHGTSGLFVQSNIYFGGILNMFTAADISEAIANTEYSLLLSASAVSKDEGTYTPSSVTVKITETTGTVTDVIEPANLPTGMEVWYLNGAYDPSWVWADLEGNALASMPAFANVSSVITVLLVNTTDEAIVDLKTIPITASGHDGAGQAYVTSTRDMITIDCDNEGRILTTKYVTIDTQLYYGSSPCLLSVADCTYSYGGNSYAPTAVTNYKVRKSFTFTAGNTLESSVITAILVGEDSNGNTHTAQKTIAVIANRKGDTGASGQLRYRGAYESSTAYVWNDDFRDVVKQGSIYYMVNIRTEGSTSLNTPDENNTNWKAMSSFSNIATDLLLAEQGTIDLLYSNTITMYDDAGNKTATMNADQKGVYCIYYPSGAKLMEFNSDGYIYYYNDDDDNTVAWRLGHGGSIDGSTTDDWVPTKLCNLPSGLNTAVTSSSTFIRTQYYRFKAGSSGAWTDYDGMHYTTTGRNPETNLANLIPNGWYTPNETPYRMLFSSGTSYLAITAYYIQDGKITDTRPITES